MSQASCQMSNSQQLSFTIEVCADAHWFMLGAQGPSPATERKAALQSLASIIVACQDNCFAKSSQEAKKGGDLLGP